MIQTRHLDPNTPGSITWKLTNDGGYSLELAYKHAILGSHEIPHDYFSVETLGLLSAKPSLG
jgi:hypothetical protein